MSIVAHTMLLVGEVNLHLTPLETHGSSSCHAHPPPLCHDLDHDLRAREPKRSNHYNNKGRSLVPG